MTTSAFPAGDARDVEHLPTAECWRLAEGADLGRLAVTGADGTPDVFPLNYVVHAGRFYLRSAPGRKLRGLAASPTVAFEIDGEEDGRRWSVVVRGTATQITAHSEIAASGVLRMVSEHPGPKPHVVRITPDTITGRRFTRGAAEGDAGTGERSAPPRRAEGPGKPTSIPSFPPRWAP